MNTVLADHSTTELGTIQIAPEVLEIIAGLATIEIDGVAEMSGGIVGGISELLGLKSLTRGVKVQVGTNETIIDVSIIIEYGYRIPDVCRQIQQSVQQAVYSMTGIHVSTVHINIESVHFNEVEKL
ncbi:MAG: Asp23/Gls24 family envelope stress response protein [Paenibacillaceae bacterium]